MNEAMLEVIAPFIRHLRHTNVPECRAAADVIQLFAQGWDESTEALDIVFADALRLGRELKTVAAERDALCAKVQELAAARTANGNGAAGASAAGEAER